MKAINIFILNVIGISLLVSCKRQDQQQHDLYASTKEYFDVRDNSTFTFTEKSDTSVSIVYTSGGHLNSRVNTDIENSEILVYQLSAAGQPAFTVRCQTGSTQYKDQIALVATQNDSTFIGPVIYNANGIFSPAIKSADSVFQMPSMQINSTVFTDVVKVKLLGHAKYDEVYFAKKIGLVARKEKSGKFYYVRAYSLK